MLEFSVPKDFVCKSERKKQNTLQMVLRPTLIDCNHINFFDNRDSKTKMTLKKGTPCAFFTKYNPGQ